MTTGKTEDTQRSRVIEWADPKIGIEAEHTMDGLKFLRAILNGKIPPPPFWKTVGFKLVKIEPGVAVLSLNPGEWHYNTMGSVHGGATTAILDTAMGSAIRTKLAHGRGYSTLEIKVNFIRPLTIDAGSVQCNGRIIHIGRRIAMAEAKMIGQQGKLYALANTTCMLFSHAAINP